MRAFSHPGFECIIPVNSIWTERRTPVCCERVMRYNKFVQQGGTAYGVLVCSV
jgi:hypothetical protein